MGVLTSVLVSLATGIALLELYAWRSKLARWIVERAIRDLPPNLRDRYREEWTANLETSAPSIMKLFDAASLVAFGSARRIASEEFDAEIEALAGELHSLRRERQQRAEVLAELEVSRAAWPLREDRLRKAVEVTRHQISTQSYGPKVRPETIASLMNSCEGLFSAVQSAVHRAHEILSSRLDAVLIGAERFDTELGELAVEYEALEKFRAERKVNYSELWGRVDRIRSKLSSMQNGDYVSTDESQAEELDRIHIALRGLKHLPARLESSAAAAIEQRRK